MELIYLLLTYLLMSLVLPIVYDEKVLSVVPHCKMNLISRNLWQWAAKLKYMHLVADSVCTTLSLCMARCNTVSFLLKISSVVKLIIGFLPVVPSSPKETWIVAA